MPIHPCVHACLNSGAYTVAGPAMQHAMGPCVHRYYVTIAKTAGDFTPHEMEHANDVLRLCSSRWHVIGVERGGSGSHMHCVIESEQFATDISLDALIRQRLAWASHVCVKSACQQSGRSSFIAVLGYCSKDFNKKY